MTTWWEIGEKFVEIGLKSDNFINSINIIIWFAHITKGSFIIPQS